MSITYLPDATSDTNPYILHLNSLQRVDGIPSNFRIQLNFPILYAKSVRMLSAAIPNSFYVFNGSNSFQVRQNNAIDFIDSTTLEVTAYITPGTYTIGALMTEIKTQMELLSPDTYTLSFNSNTLHLTISSTSALFDLLWGSGTNALLNCYYELGFNQVDTGAGLSHLSPRVIAIAGPLNIFLQVSQFRPVIHDSQNFTASYCIPLNVEFGQYKYFEVNNEFDIRIRLQDFKNLVTLGIILTSDFGPVYLDTDWSAQFIFE